jgi:hypothetical protein
MGHEETGGRLDLVQSPWFEILLDVYYKFITHFKQ